MNRKHVDVIVVGAGVLGTFHAYHAALAGKSVLLLEKDTYPVQATVRNFGQVVPSGMPSDWFEFARRGTQLYREIQKSFDISVRNNGSVYIASDAEEQNLIYELKSRMDDRDYESHLLSADMCLQKWPGLKKAYCREGLFFPQEISVEPEKMIYKVLEYLPIKFRNLEFRPGTAVIDCVPSSSGVNVATTGPDHYTSEKVIVCNGAEFGLLFPDLFRSSGIVVSKLHMMRTVPMPDVSLDGNILTGLTIRRYESFTECPSFPNLKKNIQFEKLVKAGIHILFKKAADHSIIIGDSHEYAEANQSSDLGFRLNHSILEMMLHEAERIVNFDVRQLAFTWAGFYPQHPGKGIVEIDIEDRIHIRTAIGGKGMTSGPGYAQESVRRIFDLS
jgi:FAD dependent oxidoreductase TIGR03364